MRVYGESGLMQRFIVKRVGHDVGFDIEHFQSNAVHFYPAFVARLASRGELEPVPAS